MNVRVLSPEEASFEHSPGQDGDIFFANLVDERHGGPVTIGYGRYWPHQRLQETMTVGDVMVLLEGALTITSGGEARTAAPGDIVDMPKGETVEIRALEAGALTA
jgi:ethanolamine utilization protein EutQ (cupin superfamily)